MFEMKFDAENNGIRFEVFLPKDTRLGIVFGESYHEKDSDFIVFDSNTENPDDMFGLREDYQIKDTKYNPSEPDPLPKRYPAEGDLYEWRYVYYRKPDTGEHQQDVILDCPSYNKMQWIA